MAGLAVGGASVHRRVRGRAATPGPRGGPRSGRPAAAAEGDDGFAVVVAGGAVGAGLGAAVQGDAAGHAADTAQVPSPMSISQVVRRATMGSFQTSGWGGLGPVGEGVDEGVDQLGVEAAVAAEGAPVLQAALAGPAGDGLG